MGPLPRSIAVLGLGRSGTEVCRYLAARVGAEETGRVVAYDAGTGDALARAAAELEGIGVRVALGAEELDGTFDLVVASPGIPPSSGLMRSARECAARVIGEIEFAFERSRSPWLAVTGTNGKTTTTSLVAHLLMEGGVPTECVGNIGDPAIAVVDESGPSTAIVAEVSSFQLALTDAFRPRVAVLLNITPDHIDWHGSMESYVADKARVFANQGPDDTAVIDIDDPGSAPFAEELEARGIRVVRVSRATVPTGGAGLMDGMLVLDGASGPVDLVAADELLIRGAHNVSNALAAAAAASAWGVGIDAIRDGLRTFRPIAHRLQPVGVVAGVEYVNDSKATNPGATIMALTAFEDRPVVLLLGGRNKGSDFADLAAVALAGSREVVVFGEAAEEIAAAIREAGGEPVRATGLREAVAVAARDAHPGDAVLLSPACASFDEFSGYAERGEVFARIVAGLADAASGAAATASDTADTASGTAGEAL